MTPTGRDSDSPQVNVTITRISRRWSYERRILAWTLLLTTPGLVLAAITFFTIDAPLSLWIFGWLPMALFAVVLAIVVRNKAGYPLRTLTNLVEAIRNDDFAMRGVSGPPPGALYELICEINYLGADLRDKRFAGVEADLLLGKIIEELDAAVLAFGEDDRLTMINPAGEQIFAAIQDNLLGRTAESMGLSGFLAFMEPRVEQCTFPGKQGRFRIQASTYRERGLPQRLLVLTDLSLTLRQEERLAWQRLIRVIGHELNNSLTPIRSIADSLATMLERDKRPEDWDDEARAGLKVITSRADALSRFMGSYAQLTRLPPPDRQAMDLAELLDRVVVLEAEWNVELESRPEISIFADATQLEQLLINLVKNAGEANQAVGKEVPVLISGRETSTQIEIDVLDQGKGLPDSGNLFTPFFSTKPGGSGVGLLLSRQIAEAHGGTLSVANRIDGIRGCIARVSLPTA